MVALSLARHPIFELRSVLDVKALQKITTQERHGCFGGCLGLREKPQGIDIKP